MKVDYEYLIESYPKIIKKLKISPKDKEILLGVFENAIRSLVYIYRVYNEEDINKTNNSKIPVNLLAECLINKERMEIQVSKSKKEIIDKIVKNATLDPLYVGIGNPSMTNKIKEAVKLLFDLLNNANLSNNINYQELFRLSYNYHSSVIETMKIGNVIVQTENIEKSRRYKKGSEKTSYKKSENLKSEKELFLKEWNAGAYDRDASYLEILEEIQEDYKVGRDISKSWFKEANSLRKRKKSV